jgi:hypothetical protein
MSTSDYLIERYPDDEALSVRLREQGMTVDFTNMLTFNQWMREVDKWLMGNFGITHLDLTDYTYRDAYDDDATPEEAAREAVDYDGSIGVFLLEELL